MYTEDFFFELPAERIAQFPRGGRGESRLLVLDRKTKKISHKNVHDFADLIPQNSLVIFNNTRVRKARIFGANSNQKKIEFLLVEKLNEDATIWKALAKNASRLVSKNYFYFDDNLTAKAIKFEDSAIQLEFNFPITDAWLEKHGHIPLPPYIKRESKNEDSNRYQTIYAKQIGSIAAPTAGLHFSTKMMDILAMRKIETAFITLHVGLGTFLPVRSKRVEDHIMHKENYFISCETADAFEAAKHEKRPIVAIGTTTLRTLESAWDGSSLRRGAGVTSLFIYGDYNFRTANILWTNFHTPGSTLLMLVSSFCGRELLLSTYKTALNDGYVFFSYGDAMLIL